jgi:hypothetical protein
MTLAQAETPGGIPNSTEEEALRVTSTGSPSLSGVEAGGGSGGFPWQTVLLGTGLLLGLMMVVLLLVLKRR